MPYTVAGFSIGALAENTINGIILTSFGDQVMKINKILGVIFIYDNVGIGPAVANDMTLVCEANGFDNISFRSMQGNILLSCDYHCYLIHQPTVFAIPTNGRRICFQ